jgi:hypothetical protein
MGRFVFGVKTDGSHPQQRRGGERTKVREGGDSGVFLRGPAETDLRFAGECNSTPGDAVRLIIEARIEGAAAANTPVKLGVIERQDDELALSNFGLAARRRAGAPAACSGSDSLGTGGILAGRPLDVRTMRSPVRPQRQGHDCLSHCVWQSPVGQPPILPVLVPHTGALRREAHVQSTHVGPASTCDGRTRAATGGMGGPYA